MAQAVIMETLKKKVETSWSVFDCEGLEKPLLADAETIKKADDAARDGKERFEKVRAVMEEIDQSKRASFCSGFYCVFNPNLVEKTIRRSKYHLKKGALPIDPAAPRGDAYFDEKAGSPLIKICDHTNCMPGSELTYLAVKQLNRDGDLGFYPPPQKEETKKLYTLVRAHHRKGDDILRRLRGLRGGYLKKDKEGNDLFVCDCSFGF